MVSLKINKNNTKKKILLNSTLCRYVQTYLDLNTCVRYVSIIQSRVTCEFPVSGHPSNSCRNHSPQLFIELVSSVSRRLHWTYSEKTKYFSRHRSSIQHFRCTKYGNLGQKTSVSTSDTARFSLGHSIHSGKT